MELTQDLVADYLADLRAAGRSKVTLYSYENTLNVFMNYTNELSRKTIRGFINSLDCAQSGKAARFKYLSAFCSWLVREGELDESPMKGMSVPKAVPPIVTPFTEVEIEKLLGACDGVDWKSKRARLIILLLASTGMRIGELVSIRRDCIHEDVILISGKTGPRMVPINPRTAAAMRSYNRKTPQKYRGSDSLLVGERGALSVDGVEYILKETARRAGVEGVHAHRFRHSFADKALSQGMGEQSLMAIAGWTSSSMLARYTRARRTERALAEYRRMAL